MPEVDLEETRTNVDQLDDTGLAGDADMTAQTGDPAFVKASTGKPAQARSSKVGRNDPCPCGAVNPNTGKVYKYKKCGLINAPHHRG